MYAEDILLLVPSVSSLQNLLGICENELLNLDMCLNVRKSMWFGGSKKTSAARYCSRENPAWLTYAASGNVAVCLQTDPDFFPEETSLGPKCHVDTCRLPFGRDTHLRWTRRRRPFRWRRSAVDTSTAELVPCRRSTTSADSGIGPQRPRLLPVSSWREL